MASLVSMFGFFIMGELSAMRGAKITATIYRVFGIISCLIYLFS